MMKKITKATIKSFIKNNEIFLKTTSKFDGMTDGCEPCYDQSITKAERVEPTINNLGIKGAYFVNGSRDYFEAHEEAGYEGYRVYNCCGTFYLLTTKEVA
jgi:hypothetical protein